MIILIMVYYIYINKIDFKYKQDEKKNCIINANV